jgi:hypothetical protein
MGAGLFLIAIMGCADGSAACTPVATMPTRYESRAACAAATNDALATSTDFDYPTIVAECRPAAADLGRPPASTGQAPRALPIGARQGLSDERHRDRADDP